tara:strand:+ start:75 stop:1136 length:1062 start_codon:yes stop_codon:yes gene_type:complete
MSPQKISKETYIKEKLLKWYKVNSRLLPWRIKKGGKLPNPYNIFISEYMLQQTTVTSVISKYNEFIKLWPSVKKLSKIREPTILSFWSGLGYYNRAKNLLKSIKIIAKKYNFLIPQEYNILIQLPGIGDYTAKAILGIAYNKKFMPVDANIERIFARIYCLNNNLTKEKKNIKNISEKFISKNNSSNLIQAFMDYGSAVCLPRNPKCEICKIKKYCLSYKKNIVHLVPKKSNVKKNKILKFSRAYVILNNQKQILVRKRPSIGMLASMIEVPNDKWVINKKNLVHDKIIQKIRNKMKLKGLIKHSFSHFNIEVEVFFIQVNKNIFSDLRWIKMKNINKSGLPTIMKKIIQIAT